ncbi:MAG: uroporphyrinogen-III C-methyltransferase [Deltaproteobacteria bacterium]|nr:uroporphyrinogen-III C-methyltransferase [Deltaproteobacteria bacterium]
MKNKFGKVYLVGAGPGEVGLITVKGVEALKKAGCVIYDYLANEKLLTHVKKNVECIYVGKRGRFRSATQERISKLIIKKSREGKVVVRLKGGDPFILGRGGEEARALYGEGIPFEVVPGVSSISAVPAYAGIPLTDRSMASQVTVITGQEMSGRGKSAIDWKGLATVGGTIVVLMGWKNLKRITGKLIDNGKDPETPVALVRWGTLPEQKTLTGTLANIAGMAKEENIMPPVVTVIGGVVGLRKKLNWFEERPLFGRRVLVTRTRAQAEKFIDILETKGAQTVAVPVIKTVAPTSSAKMDQAIKKLSSYDWAIFTSVNGVKYFFKRLYSLGLDIRELKGVKICCIGPASRDEVTKRGIKVDLVPGEYVAEGVIREFQKKGVNSIRGKRFLLPRAEVARDVIPKEIKKLGGKIDVAPSYKTICPKKEAEEIKSLIKKGKVDVVTFTSGSTVTNFVSLFKKNELTKALKSITVACIGPVTTKTAEDFGLTVKIKAKKYTLDGLASAMERYFTKEL